MHVSSILRSAAAGAVLAGAVFLACATPHCNDRKVAVAPDPSSDLGEPVTMHGATRDFQVYRTKTAGPPVLLLHELPGLSDATFRLARRIGDRGYTVYVPLLFGSPGDYKPSRNFLRHCVFGREFDCFRSPESSGRIVSELVVIANAIDAEHEGDGIGAVGMCLTGAIPLELIGRGVKVKAAMLSQPTLPLFMKRELAVPRDAIRIANQGNVRFVGARFSRDGKSPRERMERLESELMHYSDHDIPGFPKNAHAVLTSWLCDEDGHPTRAVLDDLLTTFDAALKGKSR